MGSTSKEMEVVRHRSRIPSMRGRYGRSVRSGELLLMNTILNRTAAGWHMIPAYHIPQNISSGGRVATKQSDADGVPSGNNYRLDGGGKPGAIWRR